MSVAAKYELEPKPIGKVSFTVHPTTTNEGVSFYSLRSHGRSQDRAVGIVLPGVVGYELSGRRLFPGQRARIDEILDESAQAVLTLQSEAIFGHFEARIKSPTVDTIRLNQALDIAEIVEANQEIQTELLKQSVGSVRKASKVVHASEQGIDYVARLLRSEKPGLIRLAPYFAESWWTTQLAGAYEQALRNPEIDELTKCLIQSRMR